LSLVYVEIAGMEMRRVRVAKLPQEVPDGILRVILTKYGTMKGISK
jgi:hypothetical protein